MAKAKGKKGPGGGVNSHIYSRLRFLHDAATYLQSATAKPDAQSIEQRGETEMMSSSARIVPQVANSKAVAEKKLSPSTDIQDRAVRLPQLSRVYVSQMHGVSLKSQIRLPIEQKRKLCKRCDTILIPGANCMEEIRNPSRGSKKPWAAVLVKRCDTCGTEKRFPLTDRRSSKLSKRKDDKKVKEQSERVEPT